VRAAPTLKARSPPLRTNFFKTELELGHCLRSPAESLRECDLYLA
jgi:hypothetical protein